MFAANASNARKLDPNYLVQISRDAWKDIIGAVDRHNDQEILQPLLVMNIPAPNAMDNLHRNVILEEMVTDIQNYLFWS